LAGGLECGGQVAREQLTGLAQNGDIAGWSHAKRVLEQGLTGLQRAQHHQLEPCAWHVAARRQQRGHVLADERIVVHVIVQHERRVDARADPQLAQTVTGEDFTLRGAQLVASACDAAGTSSERRDALADSIVAHFTPGLRYEHNPIGYYIQAGALLDLGGTRMRDLPQSFLRSVYARHPQRDMRALLLRSLVDEARAVTCGRVALLQASGLSLAVRMSPTRSY